MTDFHAHILPGADHGSDSLETSLRQLELAEQAGIDTVVATPHYYPQTDDFGDFLRRRSRTYDLLMQHYHGRVRILVGAEVHMCPGLDHLEGVDQLLIEHTNVMLCELSLRGYPKGMDETFERLMEGMDVVPLLAHVNRYEPRLIENLFALGLPGQLNAEALCHHRHRRRYQRWIDEGQIHALGSDIHGTALGYSQYCRAVEVLDHRAAVLEQRARRLLGFETE